ncbi:alpha/beta fold hydrolase [Corynebacterium lowii]|uniref:Alpha/beta hydrolase family protein n=1 Tax=Corynebacterium lowii TaxID=1544413 RepID=A0A0Q0U8L6_9CORY|nr:alpha/beta fold hydrolase [Corynebacterium lowii]KQB84005.1 Alpha/beta hydrolase family protein [Corynebacterium lowii]MDP9852745.1 pimeloyl-ACP methyl ester carboxylesterase [Corynebacterium lowii]
MRLVDVLPTKGVAPYLPGLGTSMATGIRPVLVLHGAVGNPGNFEVLLQLLAAQGDRTVCAPAYGRRSTALLEESQEELGVHARRLVAASPDGLIDVVGHSLGGLHGLLLAQRFPVARLIGLGACFRGCPVRGRKLARWALGPVYEQIMRELSVPLPAGTHITSFFSDRDAIVPPAYSDLSGLPGASAQVEMVPVAGVRHHLLPDATAREVLNRL